MRPGGSAVVLLHGLNASGDAWQDVVPLLGSYHEVYAPTAMGHRGGPPVHRRPATISTLSTGPNATWMNRVYNGLISSATPWVVLWPSNWHGVGERPPCARFRLAASGHLVTDCGNGRWQRLQTAPGWLVSCGPSHRFH